MLKNHFKSAFLTPILSIKKSYLPLLLVYFAYGAQGIAGVTLTFWEKENLPFSTEQFIIIGTWLTMPWTLKMIFGQLVDTFPLFGSRRKAYLILGATLMSLGYALLYALMAKTPWVMGVADEFTIYLTSSLLSVFGFMIQDVTADTMTTEVVERETVIHGKKFPRDEAEIKSEITMVQILGRLSLMIAGLCAALVTGKLAEIFSDRPQEVIKFLFLIPLLSLTGAAFITLQTETHTEKPTFNRLIMGGGLFYGAFILFMAFWEKITQGLNMGIIQFIGQWNQEITFTISLILIGILLYEMIRKESKSRQRAIVFAFLAIFIFRATPGVGPGFSWWAIDILKFDRSFLGTLSIIGASIPLIILWIGSDYISNRSIRSILMFLTLLGTVLTLPELALYYGWYEYFGISPQWVTVADTALSSPLTHISMIPTLALIAYFAPAHARGTWFALGSSFMNLALTASELGTKYLNQIFIVSREIKDGAGMIITPMDYSHLGPLILWVIAINLVIPLIAIYCCLGQEKVGDL